MKTFETGKDSTIIGKVSGINKGEMILITPNGAKRKMQRLSGIMLPRIC